VVDLTWTRWRTCLSVRHCTGDKLMCNSKTGKLVLRRSSQCESIFMRGLGRLNHLKSPSIDTGDSVIRVQHVKEMVQSSKMVRRPR
jgi:hypothetical protein